MNKNNYAGIIIIKIDYIFFKLVSHIYQIKLPQNIHKLYDSIIQKGNGYIHIQTDTHILNYIVCMII